MKVKKPTRVVVEKKKHHFIPVRLPSAISERFLHQTKRLSTSMNALARMAIIKLIEEEEAKERNNNLLKGE